MLVGSVTVFPGHKLPHVRFSASADNNPVQSLYRQLKSVPAPLLLMFDYDGTLREINGVMQGPEEAKLQPDQERLIRELSRNPKVQVAIVSGRSVDSMLKLFSAWKGANILLVGQFSAEIYDLASGRVLKEPPESIIKGIDAIRTVLLEKEKILNTPGVRLEDKKCSLTVHYHDEPGRKWLAGKVDEALLDCPGFVRRDGKKRYEVLHESLNKGVAVDELLRLTALRGNRSYTPVFIGDDISDVFGFLAAHNRGGGGIIVNNPVLAGEAEKTVPRLGTLQTIAELYELLRKIISDPGL